MELFHIVGKRGEKCVNGGLFGRSKQFPLLIEWIILEMLSKRSKWILGMFYGYVKSIQSHDCNLQSNGTWNELFSMLQNFYMDLERRWSIPNTTNLGMHNGMRFYIRFSENWCEMSTYSTRLFNLRSIGNYLRYLFLMYAIWSRCQVSCVWKSIPFQALAKHAMC